MSLPRINFTFNAKIRLLFTLLIIVIIISIVPAFGVTHHKRWTYKRRLVERLIKPRPVAPPPTLAPSTSQPDNTSTTTRPATTSTTTPTTEPPEHNRGFPSLDSTGVSANTQLKAWSATFRSDSIPTTQETVDGISYRVIENYLIGLPAGSYFYITGSNTLIRNTRFIGHGEPSNTGALIQGNGSISIRFDNVDVIANGYSRGLQSDSAHIIVNKSKFINTSDSAIEKNDRAMSSDLTVTNSYISSDCSWVQRDPESHTDGIQWGGARNILVRNNTILIEAKMDTCVSNSAIGGWAELGNVNNAIIDHNLLAGGGATVYMQAKSGYSWKSASFMNNTLDRRYGGAGCTRTHQTSGLWKSLFGDGLPSLLTWSSNTFEDGSTLTLEIAKSELGC